MWISVVRSETNNRNFAMTYPIGVRAVGSYEEYDAYEDLAGFLADFYGMQYDGAKQEPLEELKARIAFTMRQKGLLWSVNEQNDEGRP